jgi:hypothetical protein
MSSKRPTFLLAEGTRIRITSHNVRSESHGEQQVPSADLGIQLNGHNDMLAMFDSKLKAALYEKTNGKGNGSDEGQGELALPVSDLPHVRFPDLAPLHHKRALEGYSLTLNVDDEPVDLHDCKVNKFSFECIEGGSLIIRFRVQCAGIDAATYGKLAMAYTMGTDLECELSPPAEAQKRQTSLADDAAGVAFP